MLINPLRTTYLSLRLMVIIPVLDSYFRTTRKDTGVPVPPAKLLLRHRFQLNPELHARKGLNSRNPQTAAKISSTQSHRRKLC